MFPSKRNRTSRKNNNESNSVNFTIEEEDSNNRLATINTDIEKRRLPFFHHGSYPYSLFIPYGMGLFFSGNNIGVA